HGRESHRSRCDLQQWALTECSGAVCDRHAGAIARLRRGVYDYGGGLPDCGGVLDRNSRDPRTADGNLARFLNRRLERSFYRFFFFDANAVAPFFFRAVERAIGATNQLLHVHFSRHGLRESEAPAPPPPAAGPLNAALGDLSPQRLGDAAGAGERCFRQKNEELFAAVSALEIRAAQHIAHTGADRVEHGVSTEMTVRIVDFLEVIQIEQDQRPRRLTMASPPQ